jgi:hypothetical protein
MPSTFDKGTRAKTIRLVQEHVGGFWPVGSEKASRVLVAVRHVCGIGAIAEIPHYLPDDDRERRLGMHRGQVASVSRCVSGLRRRPARCTRHLTLARLTPREASVVPSR